ncbi:hypothetical protein CPC16_000517 [Podila verticillata]|nr:hypothetical protein CPC16_000517 [Podila verticillata]
MSTASLNERLLAKIAADVLEVDKDLKPEVSRRIVTTQDSIMTLDFRTSTLKLLRTVVNSSLEMVQMVVNTMGAFDDVEQVQQS